MTARHGEGQERPRKSVAPKLSPGMPPAPPVTITELRRQVALLGHAARDRSLETTLEILAPADWLNANDRGHWAKTDAARAAWRQISRLTLRRLPLQPIDYRVRIVCTFHKLRAGGRWDAANLYPTAKAIVDGLVDAGLLLDDSNRYVEGPDCRPGAARARPAVTVTITPSLEAWPPT